MIFRIYQETMMILILFTVLMLMVNIIECHYIKKLNLDPFIITSYTNQSKQYPIPFKKCFKVRTQIQANKKYYQFKSTSLNLNKLASFQIAQNHNISLLETLRSSLTHKHKAMTVLDDNLIMLYSMPNKILIIKEENVTDVNHTNRTQFKISDQYRIQQMRSITTPFKLYKFSKDRSIMIIQNHKFFYLLSDRDYQHYSLPLDITLVHLELLSGNDILIAQFNKGLGHYKLNPELKRIQLVKRYTKQDLKLSETYIVDVNTHYVQKGEVYLLDAKAGLIKMKYDKITNQLSQPEIIVSQGNCEAFDSVSNDYFVLLCQVQGYSSIIQIYRKQQNGKVIYERLQPIYYNSYFTDIEVSNKFYMIFSNKLINVFWNTKENRLPQALETQSQISIPGLQTFKLKKVEENGKNKVYLYSVESGRLVKYLLQESQPKLTFNSKQLVQKNLTIYLYGSCQQIEKLIQQNTISTSSSSSSEQNNQDNSQISQNNILTCELRQPILLNIQPQMYTNDGDYEISASIIILLILIFLVIIWICLKKYKGLQKQARKVLQVYKKKKNTQSRAI